MFFNSANFKTLEFGANMSWMEQQLHTQNLSNIETPGYKAKELEFSQVLSEIDGEETLNLTAEVVTNDDLSLLQDGNNVDSDKESLELYTSYVQYSMFLDKISGQFTKYSYVLNNSNM